MAALLDVPPSHVQRDYVHSWLHPALYSRMQYLLLSHVD